MLFEIPPPAARWHWEIRLNQIQGILNTFLACLDFETLSAFSQRNCPFPLKWTDFFVMHSSTQNYIFFFLLMQLAVLQAKWQLAFFPSFFSSPLLFFTSADGFFLHFSENTRGKKDYFHFSDHLLPFQWWVTLFLFDFICSLSLLFLFLMCSNEEVANSDMYEWWQGETLSGINHL